MNLKIASLPNVMNANLPKVSVGTQQGNDGDFAQMLTDVLKEVNTTQQQSVDMQKSLMTNQPVELHDLKIALERASTSMQLTLQVRNKVLEAYQEIMRLQV
jgi:flagellar hook-basal body complex protein FliE